MISPEERQRAYYAEHASAYAASHEGGDSAHDRALEQLVPILRGLSARSLLDVGSGTGRALRYFREHMPELNLAGVEPSPEMIAQAELNGLAANTIVEGTGTSLPFPDASFDVVTAFGVMHHVPVPGQVLAEMARVARRAIFISDGNRYAQGHPLARALKSSLATFGLWRAFDWVRTRGRGYMISKGDGLYYSYSVFDSLPALRRFAKELVLIELETSAHMPRWSGPFFNASTLLVGAVKPKSTQTSP
jgi:SAM-dependent methyltransferase